MNKAYSLIVGMHSDFNHTHFFIVDKKRRIIYYIIV